jgi:hypothetical protein
MGGLVGALAGPVLGLAGGLIGGGKRQTLLRDKLRHYELLQTEPLKWQGSNHRA